MKPSITTLSTMTRCVMNANCRFCRVQCFYIVMLSVILVNVMMLRVGALFQHSMIFAGKSRKDRHMGFHFGKSQQWIYMLDFNGRDCQGQIIDMKPPSGHGLHTKGEWSVRLNSLYKLSQISCFLYWKTNIFLFYKTSYLHKEVNCTEASPSVRVP